MSQEILHAGPSETSENSSFQEIPYEGNETESEQLETQSSEDFSVSEEPQEKTPPKKNNFIKKRIAAAALAATITFGAASCEIKPAYESPDPSTSSSATFTPESSPSATETTIPFDPTPETTPSQKPVEVSPSPKIENIAVTPEELDARLALAPEIPGLAKKIESNKVVYFSQEGNEYGLEANMYAGEYHDNVNIEGTKTGGVGLVPEVAQKLLADELSKVPEGENKLKIIIPFDISQTNDENQIDVDIIGFGKLYLSCIDVKSSEKLNVLNVIPGQSALGITSPYDFIYKESDKDASVKRFGGLDPGVSISGTLSKDEACNFINYFFSFDSFTSQQGLEASFGDQIGTSADEVVIAVYDYQSNVVQLQTTDLLIIDNHPVLMASHQTGK